MQSSTIGIIGCGNISDAYLQGAGRSDLIKVKAVADINADAASEKAKAFDVEAMSVDRLLADPDIEIVINITVPLAHAKVSQVILSAGKHVYSEKPLAATLDDGRAVVELAESNGLRIGCAPDTFLGAGHQACRRVVDHGDIGRVVGGAASFLTHGMEDWHPNPTFFFKPGGGPILDMAPYYLTALINMIGPVRYVTSMTTTAFTGRTVTSKGPMTGKVIDVEVPTTMNGVLAFQNGAAVTLTTTWDVWNHDRRPIEIYGEGGSMLAPDPNFFGGEPQVAIEKGAWEEQDISAFAFGIPNRPSNSGAGVADYRIIGLLDMAAAIRSGRPHRANGHLAFHVLEVMDALRRSSIEQRHIEITSCPDRPAALPEGDSERVFL